MSDEAGAHADRDWRERELARMIADDEPERELWMRVSGRGVYRWMVWTVGPATDGSQWFKTETEARAALAGEEK